MATEYNEIFVNTSFGNTDLLDQVCDELRRRGEVIDTLTTYYGAFRDVAGYKVVSHPGEQNTSKIKA